MGPPHPTMGQLISQTGSEDLVKEAAKKRMRVRGSDLCPFLDPHPPALALHGRLSDEGQDSTPLWRREVKPGVPTHHLLTRDDQGKKKYEGPEYHSVLKRENGGDSGRPAVFVRPAQLPGGLSNTLGRQDSWAAQTAVPPRPGD